MYQRCMSHERPDPIAFNSGVGEAGHDFSVPESEAQMNYGQNLIVVSWGQLRLPEENMAHMIRLSVGGMSSLRILHYCYVGGCETMATLLIPFWQLPTGVGKLATRGMTYCNPTPR